MVSRYDHLRMQWFINLPIPSWSLSSVIKSAALFVRALPFFITTPIPACNIIRSEERRVGKECRL